MPFDKRLLAFLSPRCGKRRVRTSKDALHGGGRFSAGEALWSRRFMAAATRPRKGSQDETTP